MGLRSEEVGRQEEEPGAAFGDGLFDCRALVGSEVVGDDDIAWPQDGGELGPHIEFEDLAVHRPVDDERRDQAIFTRAGDEGFDLRMSEGHGGLEPLAFRRPAKEPGHLGAVAVSSRKTRRWGGAAHGRQPHPDPFIAPAPDVRSLLLGGDQSFI